MTCPSSSNSSTLSESASSSPEIPSVSPDCPAADDPVPRCGRRGSSPKSPPGTKLDFMGLRISSVIPRTFRAVDFFEDASALADFFAALAATARRASLLRHNLFLRRTLRRWVLHIFLQRGGLLHFRARLFFADSFLFGCHFFLSHAKSLSPASVPNNTTALPPAVQV